MIFLVPIVLAAIFWWFKYLRSGRGPFE